MMKQLVMKLNENNLEIMIKWCKANNIEFDVIEDGVLTPPSLNNITFNPTSTTTKSTTTKGLKGVQYTIKKVGKLYCISRGKIDENGKFKNGGWTRAEKSCINNAIKSLDGIQTQEKSVEFNYISWGYPTKKKAEEMVKTLPTEFSAEEIAKFDK